MCIAGDTAAQESGEFVFTYFLPPAKEFNKACGTSYICYSFCFLTIFFFYRNADRLCFDAFLLRGFQYKLV